ncbi:Glycosyl transferase family 2 [Thalassococcus halodurans]|uniref:Glycosyl transferase family 2 n=1 Tax=Thalassococcus halodurans TaxID=373675 RepID=A0A1H5XFI4_9RHOB|nr:glycosyltransferase family 2 protein [Thalassococcus halodurans]SEG09966.1 Glycosyl transferase family 2 [Thalassococcus halodurans]
MIPRVSIAMASYNGSKYIVNQLQSFAAQRRLPDEVVVCDDRSTDGTFDLLQKFQKKAPFEVRLHQNDQNIGYSKNFAKALSLCSGDVIFISDQDDFWQPSKIEFILKVFENEPKTQLVVNDMVLTDTNLTPTPYTQLGNILAAGGKADEFYSGCCMALRRPLLDLATPFPENFFAHDNWINHLAVPLGVRSLISKPLQLYRRHDQNASNWMLSSPTGVSQFSRARAAGLGSAAEGWKDQIERYQITLERLASRTNVPGAHDDALQNLQFRIKNLDARLTLCAKSRVVRWHLVLALWLRGGYTDFAGWKSAVKDLIRP